MSSKSIQSKITKVEVRYVPDNLVKDTMPKAMLGMPDGYLPPDQLEIQDNPGLEHKKREANHPKNLDTIYKAFQMIDGTDDERCAQLRIRSMTYGDAIVIDGVAYYVAADGFVVKDAHGNLVPVSA